MKSYFHLADLSWCRMKIDGIAVLLLYEIPSSFCNQLFKSCIAKGKDNDYTFVQNILLILLNSIPSAKFGCCISPVVYELSPISRYIEQNFFLIS